MRSPATVEPAVDGSPLEESLGDAETIPPRRPSPDPGEPSRPPSGSSASRRPSRASPAAASRGRRSAGGRSTVIAVDGVDLEIRDGEFFSMLGPSGSGKTTTLRMIAGFELPTDGRVFLHGEDVTHRPPFERDVNTVFQDYALFPHMSVGDNVAYGLTIRKVPKAGARAARRRGAGDGPALGLRAPQARPALGRAAAARRARARARQPAPRPAPRRAARRARPEAPRGDAARAQGRSSRRSGSRSST